MKAQFKISKIPKIRPDKCPNVCVGGGCMYLCVISKCTEYISSPSSVNWLRAFELSEARKVKSRQFLEPGWSISYFTPMYRINAWVNHWFSEILKYLSTNLSGRKFFTKDWAPIFIHLCFFCSQILWSCSN